MDGGRRREPELFSTTMQYSRRALAPQFSFDGCLPEGLHNALPTIHKRTDWVPEWSIHRLRVFWVSIGSNQVLKLWWFVVLIIFEAIRHTPSMILAAHQSVKLALSNY